MKQKMTLLDCFHENHQISDCYNVHNSITNEYIDLGHVTIHEDNVKEAEIGYMILPEHWEKDIVAGL